MVRKSSAPWVPLHRRIAATNATLVDGVPPYLAASLSSWITAWASSDLCARLALDVRVQWRGPGRNEDATLARLLGNQEEVGAINAFLDAVVVHDVDLLLDVAEGIVDHRAGQRSDGFRSDPAVTELNDILTRGGSAWSVSLSNGLLVQRVDPTVQAATDKAITSAAGHVPSAADHLQKAWFEAFGRAPDPPNSYMNSVMAVESAAIPVISPRNKKATLGTLIIDLRQAPAKWDFAIPGTAGASTVEPVILMMQTLWQGNVRHGAVPTPTVSPREAEAAVHLAVVLVQWFASGAVRRR